MIEDKVVQFQKGDQDSFEDILNEYKGLIYYLSFKYYVDGMTHDDLYQEGVIALLKAANNFDAKRNDSFGAFCTLVIKRRLFSLVKTVRYEKHSFNKNLFSNGGPNIYALNGINQLSPQRILECKELKQRVKVLAEERLTVKERLVFDYSLLNENVFGAVEEYGLTYKQVDNGLQRAKAKMKKEVADYMDI